MVQHHADTVRILPFSQRRHRPRVHLGNNNNINNDSNYNNYNNIIGNGAAPHEYCMTFSQRPHVLLKVNTLLIIIMVLSATWPEPLSPTCTNGGRQF